MKKISIAIDGPASSGKSTVAKIIAKKMNYIYCDTGAMYRAITYLAIQNNINFEDEVSLLHLIESHLITFEANEQGQKVLIDNNDVTEFIRQPDVTNSVSIVSKHLEVRRKLVAIQREIAQDGGIVMDGRDIGTAVLPEAEVKIFLIATSDARAQRRYKENIDRGISTDYDTLKREIEKRDLIDSTRSISPLVKASDAIEIDTTGVSINDVVAMIEQLIESKTSISFEKK